MLTVFCGVPVLGSEGCVVGAAGVSATEVGGAVGELAGGMLDGGAGTIGAGVVAAGGVAGLDGLLLGFPLGVRLGEPIAGVEGAVLPNGDVGVSNFGGAGAVASGFVSILSKSGGGALVTSPTIRRRWRVCRANVERCR